MCGVAALFAYHYAALGVDPEELKTIREHMKVRGPDGSGEWFSSDRRVALGHRRLSVIDLSENAAQPMRSENGDLVISFNGEIYNYKELRKKLEQKGHIFKTHSDTEVLLHLYAEKGEAMARELRGMFAFALWDGKNKTLVLARDPYGIKPLYYADDGWTVRVASQVKALLAGGKVSRVAEPAGAAGFLLMGSVPEPYTLYQEIRQVPAGSFVVVKPSGVSSPRRYFSIAEALAGTEKNDGFGLEGRTNSMIRKALSESLRYHQVADVPVGLFLSGGIDSGVLAALAHEDGLEGMQAITLAFEEYQGTGRDESLVAKKVAARYQLKHHVRFVTKGEFETDLQRIFDAMDQPSLDGINTYFVSKAAREAGLKVILSGVGADELFGGYASFSDIPKAVRCGGFLSRLPFLGDLFRRGYEPLARFFPGASPKMAGLLKYAGSPEGAYFLRRGLFMPWELKFFMGEEAAHEGFRRLGFFNRIRRELKPSPRTFFKKVVALESSFYLRNQLLRDTDWAGMAHSIEVRTPYVDAMLLKSLAPWMSGPKDHFDKGRLSQCPSFPLPQEVLDRPKTGFHIPVDLWMEKEQQKLGGHWSRAWAHTVYNRSVKPVMA
ncbi:MAG: asparagine synthase (glutamine-hydrolyzing) [Candidatus Omnitrophica bacterium]|nr:asparagine synthase (glutamine-hydrolyzing) [Candidatus Omnitrophota bacterium]